MENVLSPLSASWPCPEKAGQGHRHDSISNSLNACLFPNNRPVNGSKLSPRGCHRCWRPPTWSLGPSGPSGVLPSPADQAHRRAQGSEAAKFSCFPHPTVALPYPAYVPARRPPPLPSSSADPLNLFLRFRHHLFYFWPTSKTTCRKPKHLVLRSFLISPSSLTQEK